MDGKPSFQDLQRVKTAGGELVFFLFDLLELDGTDWRRRPLTARRAALKKIMPSDGSILRLSPILPGDVETLMEAARAQGFEGIIAKREDSRYEEGDRSGAWQKWKAEQTGTFLVGGYVPGARGFDELIIGMNVRTADHRHGHARTVTSAVNSSGIRGDRAPAARRAGALRPCLAHGFRP